MDIVFPDDFLQQSFNEELKIGCIIHRFEAGNKKPSNKFSIIVGISEDSISVARTFINTGINPNCINSIELKNLQINLLKDDHEFLNHDYSFVDCSKINEITIEQLEKEYLENPKDFFIDKLREVELQNVKKALSSAKTIKPILRKKYCL